MYNVRLFADKNETRIRRLLKINHVWIALLLAIAGCSQLSHTPTETDTAKEAAEQTSTAPVANSTTQAEAVDNAPLRRDWAQSELDQQPDLWSRMRQQMYLRVPERSSVRQARDFYAKQSKYWRELSLRADPIMYHVVRKLEQRNMPVELALLPIVESAYNMSAQGAGPAGLWQLVPGTAKNFGLTINGRYDGRKDGLASTDATLDYLQDLYNRLGHDWLNAVAAYNTGEGRIQAAIMRNEARGKPIDFWSLNIPEKYIKTVPKWLAMIQLVKEPTKYGLQLPELANKPSTVQTSVRAAISLQEVAKISGVALSEIKALNPAFRSNVTPVGKSWPLLLPEHAADRYQQNEATLVQTRDTSPLPIEKKPSSKPQTYTVKSGDTVGSIAKKFKISAKSLRAMNKLKSDKLKPGQSLLVSNANSSAAAASTAKQPTMYKVQSGDSLDKIARKHKVKVADLMKWNKLKKNYMLLPNQQLIVKPAQ